MTDASGVRSLRHRLTRLARITTRVVAVTFMLVVVLGALWWGWHELDVRRTEKQVSALRKWDVRSLPLSNPTYVTLKTRCAESKLYYQLSVQPVRDEAALQLAKQDADIDEDRSNLVDLLGKNIEAFLIHFYDADGFELTTVTVEQWTVSFDKKGRAYGVGANTFTDCDALTV